MREYRLMYLFGVWITSSKIYAETDKEAIFDADCEMANIKPSGLYYALWDIKAKKIVKSY